MGHVTAQPDWGTLDIDTTAGSVLVREDWKYTWKVLGAGLTPWTLHDKQHFHWRLDREIWGRWSHHYKLGVKGTSPFAQRFAGRNIVLDYDIRWVLKKEQWNVNVYKVPAGTSVNIARSYVQPEKHYIRLYSIIFTPYSAGNDAGASRDGFMTGPHEFGHTMVNPDEYLKTSPYLPDADSLMSIGHQLRTRHAHLVVETLNTMIPGTTFYV